MKDYINIISIHIKLLYNVFFIRKKYSISLITQLNSLLAPHDQQLTADQLKRIHVYTVTGFYVNSCLATLRCRKMSVTEIKNTLHFSILTLLLDDLTDTLKFTSTEILEQLTSDTVDNNVKILLPKYLYGQIIEQRDNALFHKTFKQALLAQDESLEQLKKELLTDEHLNCITSNKGGYWTLLFRLMLAHPLKNGEKDAIHLFGQLLQLTNDMYDVYKDANNGQQTLFTNAIDITCYEQEYHRLIHDMMQQFYSLDYDRKTIRKCLYTLCIIPVLGKVCLKQLKSCQTLTDDTFKIASYTRRQLVCDMEKWANRLEYTKLSIQYYRQVRKFE